MNYKKVAVAAIIVVGAGIAAIKGTPVPYGNPADFYQAEKLTVNEHGWSWAKRYDIEVDGKKVAEVSGKMVEVFGDVFTLKTIDGKVLAQEKEDKRFLSLTRAASCYDSQGNLMGYIGEEVLSNLFSMSYVFHFYDKDKNELGTSKKLGKSAFNWHTMQDNERNVDYGIDKKLTTGIWGDKYIVTINDRESAIPREMAVLMTCIEDVIGDSHD